MVLPHRMRLLTPFSPEWEREKSTHYFLAKAQLKRGLLVASEIALAFRKKNR